VPDPVGSGFVASLARPGSNATGFTNFEFGMSAKWPELLKQIAPSLTRVAVLRDPGSPVGIGELAAIQAVAPQLRLEARSIDVRSADEIERGILEFAGLPNGGLIVLSQGMGQIHRKLIMTLAARHRLPAIYPYRNFVTEGGLVCYGPNQLEEFSRAAGYVDRILKGEKPADLPVQAPTKYELIINLKTAKALGLEIPPTLLARADEVIE
jgi:putative ABC transport system substrate-binding protein